MNVEPCRRWRCQQVPEFYFYVAEFIEVHQSVRKEWEPDAGEKRLRPLLRMLIVDMYQASNLAVFINLNRSLSFKTARCK